MDRGYPNDTAVRYVSDHHRLPEGQRIVLLRTIVSAERAQRRMAKALRLHALRGRAVFVDGYNALITTESLLAGFPVYLCDDGFLRDTRGFFKSYKESRITVSALCEIFDLLAQALPSRVEVLLDQQISRSGELAKEARSLMAERDLPGEARCARDVDHQLKVCGSIVASSDGNVIDAASSVIDLPGEIARERGISPLLLE
ncbi:MAG: DUF434 domain-containing protein [Methanothrix sp.]|nr:DUF434 domain-containing protein [Methanothrix sp.]